MEAFLNRLREGLVIDLQYYEIEIGVSYSYP